MHPVVKIQLLTEGPVKVAAHYLVWSLSPKTESFAQFVTNCAMAYSKSPR